MAAVRSILENALELDPGRYVRGGGADVLLYATRLAMRVEAFARFVLSPDADAVRGLRTPAVGSARDVLSSATDDLHALLEQQVVPLLLSWYARARREMSMTDACTIATHIAFAYSAIAASQADDARNDELAVKALAAAAAADDGFDGGAGVGGRRDVYMERDELPLFALLSSRVFINVHHDFGLEPRTALHGSKERGAGRKKGVFADFADALGFEPLDVFDLWQRELGGTMRWLQAHPEESCDVMENVVRLLSGDKKGKDERLTSGRQWAELPIRGCAGRFVPGGGGLVAEGGEIGLAGGGGGGGGGGAAAASKPEEKKRPEMAKRFSLVKRTVREKVMGAPEARGGMEVYEAWLRQHVSTVSETEVNVQLGDLTLNQHQMQLLDQSISEHEDFVAVFGDAAANSAQSATANRHQCGEVERTEHRHWYRLIAVEHDVQVWDPDARPPPGPIKAPRASIIATSSDTGWVREALAEVKKLVPALGAAQVIKNVGAGSSYALFYAVLPEVGVRELMVTRQPLAVHVWRLESYGRRWLPVLESTTDTRYCLAELPAHQLSLEVLPAPHWAGGEPHDPATSPPASSVLVHRPKTHVGGRGPMSFLPSRHLRGLLPEALLSSYHFWQRPDGSILGERVAALAKEGAADELAVQLTDANEAIIRRVPLDQLEGGGAPRHDEARRLLTHVHSAPGTALDQLVKLLSRLDDLSHVLLWSAPEHACGAAPEAHLPLDLVELPRLRLSFRVVLSASASAASGKPLARLASLEHPGLEVTWSASDAVQRFLHGIPHALLLSSAEGELYVLIPALSKPCLLSDPADPLSGQLVLANNADGWAAGLPSTRHYLYPMHRSTAYATPPSLAAALYLLLLRWLDHDYEAVFQLAAACSSDTSPTAEELQLWSLLADLEDDADPGAHACRLRLSLATRCCPELPCPWQDAEQLVHYLSKREFVPPACQLAVPDELLLLQLHETADPMLRLRQAFLQAALAEGGAAHDGALLEKASTITPGDAELDAPLDAPRALLSPERAASWQKKLSSLHYARPEERSGADALKMISAAIGGTLTGATLSLTSDSRGFWMMYELFTSALNVRVLSDDSTHCLASLFFRLTPSKASASELVPLLRLLEAEPQLCAEMPKYTGTTAKKGVIGAMGKSVFLLSSSDSV